MTDVGNLNVAVYESTEALGQAAAADFAEIVTRAVAENRDTAVILATGNSQLAFLRALRDRTDIPWSHVTVFHMDEYIGLSDAHPASFSRYMRENVDEEFHPHALHAIRGDAHDVEAELQRYVALLNTHKPVLCVMGIGENGHLAFNDPPADFNTDKTIHIVALDQACRQQQVGEGHFTSLSDVPGHAISLTVPALLRPPHVMVLVPEARKARIVREALRGPVTETCPASLLQLQKHATVYLDRESAALL